MTKKSIDDVLGDMLRKKSSVSKCLSCRENPKRDENPPKYECRLGRGAGPDVYFCIKYKKPED